MKISCVLGEVLGETVVGNMFNELGAGGSCDWPDVHAIGLKDQRDWSRQVGQLIHYGLDVSPKSNTLCRYAGSLKVVTYRVREGSKVDFVKSVLGSGTAKS